MGDLHQRGWHSRGYLPHLDFRSAIQGVTFRLADSLPKQVIDRWKRSTDDAEILKRIAAYEDAGHGSCVLANPRCAEVVAQALRHFDTCRYDLLDWVVMPNHVHVVLKPHSDPIERILKSWKSYTARKINAIIGSSGPVWERDYFDRVIRDETHLFKARRYVRENPVKAGLCEKAEDWRWSSAWGGEE